MPRLPDDLTKSIAYLYYSRLDAERGAVTGGTAMIAAVFDRNRRVGFEYLVTCCHVVSGGDVWVRVNTAVGTLPVIRKLPRGDWTLAPDQDLAVIRLKPPAREPCMDVQAFPLFASLLEEDCRPDGYGIGDDVFTVGRFISADGGYVNVPTARFGQIAAMPCQPIGYEVPYRKAFVEQPGFLVQIALSEGYSGSPAWVYEGAPMSEATRFLGIVGASWLEDVRTGRRKRRLPLAGMAFVIPAWRVLELLYRADLGADRAAARRALKPRGTARTAGASGDPSPSTPDAPSRPPSPGSDESPSPAS